MKNLLLTGFEPFLDFPINPTEEIVRSLHDKEINNYKIIGCHLPVDFKQSGVELIKQIEEFHPDAVLSLGLAAGRHKVTPERIAINCNDGESHDNQGHRANGEPIQASGPDGLFSTLPIQTLVDVLNEEGYPASISNTAGTYLCNHVMYQELHYFKWKQMSVPAGFVHIPASHTLAIHHGELPSWSQEDLTNAVVEIIHAL